MKTTSGLLKTLTFSLVTGTLLTLSTPMLTYAKPASADIGTVDVNQGFSSLINAVKPAVVNISVIGSAPSPFSGQDAEELEEFFRRFFGDVPEGMSPRGGRDAPAERRTTAVGSGFIIDASGLVVTNHHVIDNADEIEVVFQDGKRVPAKLKGIDSKTDLALLEIESDTPLPYVTFGDSDQAKVGDWIVAIGNPFGLGGSASTGIISARGRDIQFSSLDDYIQIDAPINQGNSGGPLFNTKGEVIGVNSAIYSPNGGNVGIGFAIPASMASDVIKQLKETGTVQRGYLGINIQTVNEEIAEGLGLKTAKGALITNVNEDSPAEKAGLEVGDIVIKFNGEDVPKMRDLPKMVARIADHQSVPVVVWRDGKEQTIEVKVGVNESDDEIASSNNSDDRYSRLGLVVEDLTDKNRREYRLDDDASGVLITRVKRDSEAARKGVRAGDIIQKVGRTEVKSVKTFEKAIDNHDNNSILLLVARDGQVRYVALSLNDTENE